MAMNFQEAKAYFTAHLQQAGYSPQEIAAYLPFLLNAFQNPEGAGNFAAIGLPSQVNDIWGGMAGPALQQRVDQIRPVNGPNAPAVGAQQGNRVWGTTFNPNDPSTWWTEGENGAATPGYGWFEKGADGSVQVAGGHSNGQPPPQQPPAAGNGAVTALPQPYWTFTDEHGNPMPEPGGRGGSPYPPAAAAPPPAAHAGSSSAVANAANTAAAVNAAVAGIPNGGIDPVNGGPVPVVADPSKLNTPAAHPGVTAPPAPGTAQNPITFPTPPGGWQPNPPPPPTAGNPPGPGAGSLSVRSLADIFQGGNPNFAMPTEQELKYYFGDPLAAGMDDVLANNVMGSFGQNTQLATPLQASLRGTVLPLLQMAGNAAALHGQDNGLRASLAGTAASMGGGKVNYFNPQEGQQFLNETGDLLNNYQSNPSGLNAYQRNLAASLVPGTDAKPTDVRAAAHRAFGLGSAALNAGISPFLAGYQDDVFNKLYGQYYQQAGTNPNIGNFLNYAYGQH